jgi:hypothetical protein
MLLSDVPRGWLTISTEKALAALARLSGTSRDAAAVRLASRFEKNDVPVIAYGFPTIDTLVAPDSAAVSGQVMTRASTSLLSAFADGNARGRSDVRAVNDVVESSKIA